jgi:hypothetical protein
MRQPAERTESGSGTNAPRRRKLMHWLYAGICLATGGSLTWGGYRILKRLERPDAAPGFAGPMLGRPLLVTIAATLMVVVGLVLAIVFGLIMLLT